MRALNNYSCEGQMSIFDLLSQDSWSGKTSPEPSVQTKEKTSDVFLKKFAELRIKPPMYLFLGGGSGQQAVVSWEIGGALLGVYMMRSFGEFPREERKSHLSQILEENPHPKYCLSAKACQGILNRANRRGKKLPEILEKALINQLTPLKSEGGAEIDSYGKRAGKGALVQTEKSGTLGVSQDQTLITVGDCYSVDEKMGQTYVHEDQGNTLSARDYKQPQAVVYGLCSDGSNSMKSPNPHSGCYEADTTRTLDNNGGNPACNQGGMIIVDKEPMCIQRRFSSVNVSENGISPTLEAGAGEGGNNMPMIAQEKPCVMTYQDKTGTLSPGAHAGSYNGQDAYNDMLVIGGGTEPTTASKASFFLNARSDGKSDTLVATDYKDPQLVCYALDRASFNQGKNAQYDFSVQEDIAQPLVARGPGGVLTQSGHYVQETTKE